MVLKAVTKLPRKIRMALDTCWPFQMNTNTFFDVEQHMIDSMLKDLKNTTI